MQPSLENTGSIYDLGYRSYDGPRLGRAHAVRALYIQGLRAAFGLGRRPASKIAPFLLVGVGLLPATIFLGISATTARQADIVKPVDYFDFIRIVLALFVAIEGPEIVGRDLRHRTLPLYFSRPIERDDYALAKLAALTTATLTITLLPEIVVILGNAFSTDNFWEYFQDNWSDLPAAVVSGTLIALSASAVALAIGSQSPRRSFTTGGIMALFIIGLVLGGVIAETFGRYGLLLSPLEVFQGVTFVIFRAQPDPQDDALGLHPIGDGVIMLVFAAVTLVAIAVLIRRYRKVAA
jgi:ABC-2 type transport system permease protein